MGATGYTIFEDDMGADWSRDFLKNPSIQNVQEILNKAKSDEYLDDLEAAAALGCAELVAAALGNPVETISDELSSWAQSVADHLTPMKDLASSIVDVVEEKSELAEIWAEDPEWLQYLQDLRRRLRKNA